MNDREQQLCLFGPGDVDAGRDCRPAETRRRAVMASSPYRPRRAWAPERLTIVRGLLRAYFQRIGGFALANGRTIAAWHGLLDLFTAAEIGAAVRAKAASLTGSGPADARERRRFATQPLRFVGRVGFWLSESAVWRGRAQRSEQARADGLRRSLTELGRGVAPPTGFAGLSSRSAGLSGPAGAPHAAGSPPAALWASLSARHKLVALAAVRPAFCSRCRAWGERPESPHLSVILQDMAAAWAGIKWPDVRPLFASFEASSDGVRRPV
jgi:hypothetical protein